MEIYIMPNIIQIYIGYPLAVATSIFYLFIISVLCKFLIYLDTVVACAQNSSEMWRGIFNKMSLTKSCKDKT